MLNPNQVNIKHYLKQGITLVTFVVLLVFGGCFSFIEPAFAHRPHDVVEQLELSPNFEQDRTIFIFVRNNVFKSTDRGMSWTRLSNGLDYRYELSDLAIAPNNPKILLLSSQGDGIYQSKDEGNSWEKINEGLNNLKIGKLVISPNSSNLILATEEKGLYRTTNEGENWSKVFNNPVTAITFFPNQSKKILLGDPQGQLYLSEDEGLTWEKVTSIKNSGAITVIAFSPNFNTDSTFFVGTEQQGIYKTTDQGKTFEKVNQGVSDPWIRDIVVSKDYAQNSRVFAIGRSEAVFESKDAGKNWKHYNQGIVKDHQADEFKTPHFNDLKVANNFLYLGGFNGLFQSTDGGKNWKELETLAKGTVTALAISPDYKNDSTVAIVNYVGMPFISRDKGVTWEVAKQGLELPYFTGDFKELDPHDQDPRRFFDVAFSSNYSQDQTIFASILWTKLIKTTNGGKSWKIITLPKEVRGMTIVPSPNFAADNTVYIATQQDIIFKSTDKGETFTQIGKVGSQFSNDSPSLVISPTFASDGTLYVTGDEGIYKTVDAGKTWTATTKGTPLMEKGALRLVISPNYPTDKTVFVGTNQGVYLTRDGGEKWDRLTSIGNEYIEGISVSPNYQNDKTWIMSIRGKGLYKTVDDGKNFTQVGDNSITLATMNSLPSAGKAIQFSPAYASDNTLFGFGAANTQVYKSTDSGNTWKASLITPYQENGYDLLTSARLFFDLNRNSIARVLVALATAITTYIVLGYLVLEKRLPLKRWQIKVLGTFIVFVGALFIVFKVL